MQKGAQAGAIAGIAALIAHLIGGAAGAFMVGPEGAADLLSQFGLPTDGGATSPMGYYAGALGGACCMGLFEIALMAGLGALGGMIWFSMAGKNQGGVPPAPAAPAM